VPLAASFDQHDKDAALGYVSLLNLSSGISPPPAEADLTNVKDASPDHPILRAHARTIALSVICGANRTVRKRARRRFLGDKGAPRPCIKEGALLPILHSLLVLQLHIESRRATWRIVLVREIA
jgi:hypothetical protein